MNVPAVSAPEHLTAQHDISAFDSGVPELDTWLKRRALQNEASGASRTYVVSAGRRVVGYYGLATCAVARQEATGKVRRNTPEPIPVMVIGLIIGFPLGYGLVTVTAGYVPLGGWAVIYPFIAIPTGIWCFGRIWRRVRVA